MNERLKADKNEQVVQGKVSVREREDDTLESVIKEKRKALKTD